MNKYDYILEPKTNKKYSIYTKKGQSIIKKYIYEQQGGLNFRQIFIITMILLTLFDCMILDLISGGGEEDINAEALSINNIDKFNELIITYGSNMDITFIPNLNDNLFFSLERINISLPELIFPSMTEFQNALRPYFDQVESLIPEFELLSNPIYAISQRIYILSALTYVYGFMSWDKYLNLPSAWLIIYHNLYRNKFILLALTGVQITSYIYTDTNLQLIRYISRSRVITVTDFIINFIPNMLLRLTDIDNNYTVTSSRVKDFTFRLLFCNILKYLLIYIDDNYINQQGGGYNNYQKYKNILLNKYPNIDIKDHLIKISKKNLYLELLHEVSPIFIDIKIKKKFNKKELNIINKEKKQFNLILKKYKLNK